MLQLLPPDADGDIFAKPLEWHGQGPMPRILYAPLKADPALAPGDRILARLIEARGEVTRGGGKTIFVRGIITGDGKPALSFTGIIRRLTRR